MSDKTWKAAERKIARSLGTERTGPQGKNMPDAITGQFSVEVKTRKSLPAWLHAAMSQAKRNAVEGTEPVVVLHQIGQRHDDDLVVMSFEVFKKIKTTVRFQSSRIGQGGVSSMPDNVIKCPRCENIIGQIVTVDEIDVLQVGGALCRFVHGVCSRCGGEIHWSIADVALSRLLKTCIRETSVL